MPAIEHAGLWVVQVMQCLICTHTWTAVSPDCVPDDNYQCPRCLAQWSEVYIGDEDVDDRR